MKRRKGTFGILDVENIDEKIDELNETLGRPKPKKKPATDSARHARNRAARLAAGLCADCGRERARPGKTQCQECADRQESARIRRARGVFLYGRCEWCFGRHLTAQCQLRRIGMRAVVIAGREVPL
jgi:hypothetical protein